jgi:hypothetical protein
MKLSQQLSSLTSTLTSLQSKQRDLENKNSGTSMSHDKLKFEYETFNQSVISRLDEYGKRMEFSDQLQKQWQQSLYQQLLQQQPQAMLSPGRRPNPSIDSSFSSASKSRSEILVPETLGSGRPILSDKVGGTPVRLI